MKKFSFLLTPFIWTTFIAIKLVLFLVGLVAVPLSLLGDGRKRTPKMFWLWGNDEPGFRNEDFDSVWALLWDRVGRNPVGNSKYLLEKIFGDPDEFNQWGVAKHEKGTPDPMEAGDKIQWRARQKGLLTSARITWGKPDNSKGKNEVYFGFKLGSSVPGIGFATQVRPFYYLVIAVWGVYVIL